jgi:hypothetical protein
MSRSQLLFDNSNRPTPWFARFLHDLQIPGATLRQINRQLQARFFQKDEQGHPLERWDLRTVQVDCPKPVLLRHLKLCGFWDETVPSEEWYDYAAVPGALISRARVRMANLVEAWVSGVRWDRTVIFGGARDLQLKDEKDSSKPGRESEEVLKNWELARKDWLPPAKLPATEHEMLEWIYSQVEMPVQMQVLRVTFVNAPMKEVRDSEGKVVRKDRPTTEDPILLWLESKPEPGTMLISSGAPYQMAQEAAYETLLGPKGFEIEMFGHRCPDSLSTELLMREVAGAVNRIYRARKR